MQPQVSAWFSLLVWPRFCFNQHESEKLKTTVTNISAFKIQSRSSSPSSGPPGPPRTGLNNFGRNSIPFSLRCAASSLCISSILVFSSVAASWFCSFSATHVLYQSFCDSRSFCSSKGRARGGLCLAWVASNRTSFFPVCPTSVPSVL